MSNNSYEIQDHEFTLKPNTFYNVEKVQDYMDDVREKGQKSLEGLDEAMQSGDTEKVEEIMQQMEEADMPDAWEQRFEMFEMVTEGPHNQIDYKRIPADLLEEIIESFLPPWARNLN